LAVWLRVKDLAAVCGCRRRERSSGRRGRPAGHLGELTRIVPFEMVDAALADTGAVQHRLRLLPSRVVVYLLRAAGLFTEIGLLQVWARLCAGLDGIPVATPSPSALAAARLRVGTAPLRAHRGVVAGPAGHCGRRHHPVLPGHPGEPDSVQPPTQLNGFGPT
jgi:hypothetical protein